MVIGVCETGHVRAHRRQTILRLHSVAQARRLPSRAGGAAVREREQGKSMSAAMKSSTSVRAATLAAADAADDSIEPMIVKFLDSVWMEHGLFPNTLAA